MSELTTKQQSTNIEQATLIILPDGARAIAKIPLPFIEGDFRLKLEQILGDKGGLIEFTDEEYSLLRDVLLKLGIKFKILLGIPGVDSPRSFLSEDNYDLLMSYSNLSFTPESQADKFIKELNSQLPEPTSDTSNGEEYLGEI